jgi:heme-degrading monooxygenase HmoA
MIQIMWEFRVKAGQELQFERHYSASGRWARFFRQSPAYRGTTLLRDAADSRRYLTIDRWEDEESFQRFKEESAAEYQALDKEFEALTEEERRVGVFVGAGR